MVLATVFIFHIKALHPDIDLCFFGRVSPLTLIEKG